MGWLRSGEGPRAVSTFVFLQAWHPEWASGANPAAWSLSDETFFYLLFPLLLFTAARRIPRWFLFAAVVVAVPLGWLLFVRSDLPAFWIDYFPPARIVQFVAGVIAGVAMRRGMRAPLRYWPALALVVVFHVMLALWGNIDGIAARTGPYSGSQWWSIVPFVLVIMAAAQADLDKKATGLRNKVAIALGHWSYSLYLVHEIIVRVWVRDFGRSSGMPVAAQWLVLLLLVVTASWILYSLIEHPAEKWFRARGPQSQTVVIAKRVVG